MKKTVATGLMITYLVILFGYGLSSLTHIWLHAVENSGHMHSHSHGSIESKPNALHDIGDHAQALSELNQGTQDLSSGETSSIVFAFVFWKAEHSQDFNQVAVVLDTPNSFYQIIYESRSSAPLTPPPLS